MRINAVKSAIAAVLGMAVHAAVLAQDNWPSKPVRLVVAAAPGGSTDILGRLIAQRLTERLGQPFVVENRGGAGGGVAAAYVAKAPADGYTLLMTNDQLVVQAAFSSKLPYDPVKDFSPVSIMARGPIAIGVNPGVKANSVAELVALARAQPGKLAFASCGSGTVLQLAGELLNLSASINITHVPYRGCAPAMVDVIAGQVPVFVTVLGNAVPYEKNGKVRLLGVASAKRLPSYPDLPTIAESGIKGFVAEPWFGLLAPAQTPREVVTRLAAELAAAIESTDTKDKMHSYFLEPSASTPEEFADIIKSDLVRWKRVVEDAHVQTE